MVQLNQSIALFSTSVRDPSAEVRIRICNYWYASGSLIIGTDPDPSFNKETNYENLYFYIFVTS